MMHGRKKQLLDSYKSSGELSQHSADMSALNLNQSLTEQLTQQQQQQRRTHVDGCVTTPSRRTPVTAAAAEMTAPPAAMSARSEMDAEARCGRTAPSPSPARGPRRPADDPPPKPVVSRPGRSPDPGALAQAAAAASGFPPGIDPSLAARVALQHQFGLFPHPALHPPPPSFLLPTADSGITQHLELLYRVKYPGYPVPPPWLLYQLQDELVRDAALIQHQATSDRLEHGLRERERVDNERSATKDRQERERREMDRAVDQSRGATAADRERRAAAAWMKSSHPMDVHPDARKMQAEHHHHHQQQQQQQQQQEQRRERERALILDAGCVADAVNQHFQESLKHVEQKSYVASLPWLPPPSAVANSSAFVPPLTTLQKSPVDRRAAPSDLVVTSQHGPSGYGAKLTEKLKYEEKMEERMKYSPRLHVDERAARLKLDDQRMRYEAEERARYEEKLKPMIDDRQRYPGWRELDGKQLGDDRRHDERKRLAAKEEDWFHRDERLKTEDRGVRYERAGKYDDQRLMERAEVHREMRPRPAHNGDGLYDAAKHRDSPAMAHRSAGGPLPPPGLLQQGAIKAPPPPGQPRNQSAAEMNFNLYGYQPTYNPMYISHEKLNHALASPIKDDVPRAARQPPMEPGDEAAGKPTSVIVEHRTPRHQPLPIDPYRCRGSITHGTAAGPKPTAVTCSGSSLRAGGVLVSAGGGVAAPLTARDEVAWTKKPTCVVNGLCWTGSQTVPSAGRPSSPPNKVDLISQGLVPNPLYSSAAGGGGPRGVAEVLPKLAVAGVDYAVDMSAKRSAVTRVEPPVKRPRSDELPASPWLPLSQAQGQGPTPGQQASYIDSFKSFVDHAVQSAFMDDAEKDAAARRARLAGDTPQSAGEPSKPTMASILRNLTGSPKPSSQQARTYPGSGDAVVCRSDVPPPLAGSDVGPSRGPTPGRPAPSPAVTTVVPGVQSLSMPSLVASVGTGSTRLPSTSPAAANQGPPLLVPQCPLEPAADRVASHSPALSSSLPEKALGRGGGSGGGGDTDSDTLSAHSPAPVLVPAAPTPPPTSSASSSLNFKKTWLLRYSDEDRKNATVPCSDISRPSDSYENPQDTLATEEKSSTDIWPVKPKENSENGSEASVSDSDTKPVKPSSGGKQRQDAEKKPSGKAGSRAGGQAEDGNVGDRKDAIKNCFINCTYVSSDKEQDSRPLRRLGRDSGLDDKDAQSSASKESDDSQSGSTKGTKRKSNRTKKTSTAVPVKKSKSWSSSTNASRTSSPCPSANSKASSCGEDEDIPVKKPKHAASGKSNSSTLPSSDCESKIAARLKELKGKARIESLLSVLEKKPLNRCMSEARRKKTRESFVQDGPCYDLTPKLMKCRECKLSQGQRNGSIAGSQLANNIFCRFYAFRKLSYNTKGLITVSGFCKPTDADADDIELWLPVANSERSLSIDMAKYVVSLLSDCFTQLLDDENKASALDSGQASKVVWKRAIQGVREMCDACDATLFNVHWTCGKCGFAVCADCYRAKRVPPPSTAPRRDAVEWLTCSANRQIHEPDSLIGTQIIPSDVLPVLGRMLRDVMAKWHIAGGDWFHRQPPLPTVNGLRTSGARTPKNRKKKLAKDEDDSAGPSTPQSSLTETPEVTPMSRENGDVAGDRQCNGIVGYVNGDGLDVEDESNELGDRSGRTTTRLLDHGRLLRLSETRITADDLQMFQQHWQSSLPVLVTRPRSWFRSDIWRPAALGRCGGSPAVDGVTGVDVPAARFWDQFEHGLKGASSLRLKDWPCPDDLLAFTSHLRDLDEHLPLPEYTRTSGALHLVSHIPEYFVRPELSVLRLHAGQSSTVCGQVAPLTKLRVDAVDNVSAVVYVNEKDDESQTHVTAALEAAGCERISAKSGDKPVGVVWHVFRAQDADRIRSFVDKVSGTAASGRSDSGTDGSLYLDSALRARLLSEHAVQCCTIVQRLGDIVLVPAMSPYQICAIQNCVLASREFISPESLRYSQCSAGTRHARASAAGPSAGFEDQLQSKNLVYHAVKNSVAVLQYNNP